MPRKKVEPEPRPSIVFCDGCTLMLNIAIAQHCKICGGSFCTPCRKDHRDDD